MFDGCCDLGLGDLEDGRYAAEVVEVVDGGAGVDQLVSWRERWHGGLWGIHLVVVKEKRCVVAYGRRQARRVDVGGTGLVRRNALSRPVVLNTYCSLVDDYLPCMGNIRVRREVTLPLLSGIEGCYL